MFGFRLGRITTESHRGCLSGRETIEGHDLHAAACLGSEWRVR